MGILDFIRDAGKDLLHGRANQEAAEAIQRELENELGNDLAHLQVSFEDGRATLRGEARSLTAKEKAVLLAGNIRGVAQVDGDGLTVAAQAGAAPPKPAEKATAPKPTGPSAEKATRGEAASTFYTIQAGDTLSKIAQRHFGDANRYDEIFEANREVIKDPDLIYPGQQIRLPKA
ncbi:MAG TPA: peptidoglycan-binding protein LysM [Rubricoccaceae bacterium]|nr:peptidoglycan-binding protein LysM [Rubricoccaceae bacterium]